MRLSANRRQGAVGQEHHRRRVRRISPHHCHDERANLPNSTDIRRFLAELADSANTKERYFSLLREYQTVFFAEEEQRERPVLEKMLMMLRSSRRR